MIARLLIAFGIISFFLNAPLWGQNSLLAYRWDGESESALMGYSVSGAGDVNADGIPDFIVGAKETKAAGVFRSGSAYVFSGIDGSQ
ncbi:MAG: integrin alpha, partial [Planctomycetota bacterium]|nr:integrin alpha [Planctomycetota bacterium]